MIPTTEIRTGNWVQRPAPYHQYAQVTACSSHISLIHEGRFYYHYAFQLNPIPLTGPLLEMLSGKQASSQDYLLSLHKYNFLISPHAEGGYYIRQTDTLMSARIFFVHQLQNIIADFTGEILPLSQSLLDLTDSDLQVLNSA